MGPTHLTSGRTTNRSGPSAGSSTTGQSMDQAQALRNQIQLEIEQKAKVCANTQYECTLPRVDSYAYCFRHILQDPNAPYKQCEYVFPNARRCLEPSPKYDAKKDYGSNYCFEHSRQTQLMKTKSTIGKLVPVETTETLLHGLAHHVKVDKNKQHYMGSSTPLKITVHEDDDDTDVDVVTPSVDPFVDVDVTAINDSGRIVLDYASDSSSDDESAMRNPPSYGSSWKGHELDNSDNESVDSQGDDPLKHAGIYTAEEVTRITKEKLTRLQTLYIEQVHRLQHVLRERRRNYLKEQRAERDIHCSIYDQIKQTPRERLLYEKLKGLNRYHRKHGVEAILQRKYLEKRAKATEGLQQKPPSLPKCAYTEGGVKCGERTLPCCKHCRKHILEDKKQVLFRACGIEKSGVVCQEPLAGLFENVTCPLHMELPAQRSFNKRKYESESEGECDASAMEVSASAVPTKDAETISEEQKPAKVETTASTAEDLKGPAVKGDAKRKSIKQETITPTRARNTRAARAAMAKQEDVQQQPDQPQQQQQPQQKIDDSGIKKEKMDAVENEANVTFAHGSTTTVVASVLQPLDASVVDLEESLLPVSIIPKKKIKLDEETAPEPMDVTIDSTKDENETKEQQTSSTQDATASVELPDTTVLKNDEGVQAESLLPPLTTDKTEATKVIQEGLIDSNTANEAQMQSDDATTTAISTAVPGDDAAALEQEKDGQDETVPNQKPLTPRQRKLRASATAEKKEAPNKADAAMPSNLSDGTNTTSDEEKGSKVKQQTKGKQPEAVGGSGAADGSTTPKSAEQKSRRQNLLVSRPTPLILRYHFAHLRAAHMAPLPSSSVVLNGLTAAIRDGPESSKKAAPPCCASSPERVATAVATLFFFLAITTCCPCIVAICAAFGAMPGGGGGMVGWPPDLPNRAPASNMAP
uniref:KAT8 regulatory NSL complex subunit 2 n=1 Tax=Anopheles dirus TaxID=7168 RepID=A0A182N7S3_9DIPT